MTTIRVICTHCQTALDAPEADLGKLVRCPRCRGTVQLCPPSSAQTVAFQSGAPIPRDADEVSSIHVRRWPQPASQRPIAKSIAPWLLFGLPAFIAGLALGAVGGFLLARQVFFQQANQPQNQQQFKLGVDLGVREVARRKIGAVQGKGQPLGGVLDGVIKGRVLYDGQPAAARPIMALQDHKDCKIAGEEFERVDQTWLVTKADDGTYGVANAVVFLVPPKGRYFELADEDKSRKEVKIIDQPHCTFIPHVQAFYPSYYDGQTMQKSGQKLVVRNSATFQHNLKWQGGVKTGAGNITFNPKEERDLTDHLVPEPNPVSISCDIHSWMTAKIWVFDHPYFAVTDKDGNYEIKNVPTGVEVNVVVWHEGVAGQYFTPRTGEPKTFKSMVNRLDYKIK